MRAQCPICSDPFSEQKDVAAIPCGHTFHDECLQQWLSQSLTCPSCRKNLRRDKVIHKLYFDVADLEEVVNDPLHMKSELEAAQLEVRVKKKEMSDMAEQQARLYGKIDEVEEKRKSTEVQYKQALATNRGLTTELKILKQQENEAHAAKEEARALRKKLKDLQSVDKLINGLDDEIHNLSEQQDVKQLATWCTVIQKELEMKKQQVKASRTEMQKLHKELAITQKMLREKTETLIACRDKLKNSESDVHSADAEVISLKKKIKALQQAMHSPNDTVSSFAHRLLVESPAPMPFKKPRLSCPGEEDLNITPDLFPELDNAKDTPSTQNRKDCKEYGTQYINFTSKAKVTATSKKNVAKPQSACELKDVSNMPGLGSLNIFNKKQGFGLQQSCTSRIKKGYNGLGGHEKFISMSGVPLGIVKKKSKSASTISKPTFSSKPPPLPRMDKFIVIDKDSDSD